MGIVDKIRKIFRNKEVHENYVTKSYSQEGEDLILNRIFADKTTGFFVDIGSHHPFRFSNTYFFYRLGWTGLNVDANPGSKILFDQFRPKDINIELGISNSNEELKYYIFKEKALNTFSKDLADQYIESGWELNCVNQIKTISLRDLFQTNLNEYHKIDFMSIDIEGFELKALESNDWEIYRPHYLLIEILNCDLYMLESHPIKLFLDKRGYKTVAKTRNTFFFEDKLNSI